jgi:regulator of replication initiation timing
MSHHVGMKDRNIAHNGNDPLRVDETEEGAEETVTEEDKVEDVQESQNKLVAARKKNTALVLENKRLQKQIATTTADVKTFKDAEKQYKEAITALKNQLQEVALYTSNLTYAVKLMTENATTKDEKRNILKRLDAAKTISESKEVYTTLNESFKGAKTAKAEQIVESKLNDDKASGSSKLNETTVYSDPQVNRIKEIIQKMKY